MSATARPAEEPGRGTNWYEVATTLELDDFTFRSFTGDSTMANYSNITAATRVGGMWVTMGSADYICLLFGGGATNDIHTPMTAHGGVATPNGGSSWFLVWGLNSSLPAGTYGFGYDNDTDPMDVSWFLKYGDGFGVYCDWTKPVGQGKGPLHDPAPEPATLSLLAVGIGTLMLRRRRT